MKYIILFIALLLAGGNSFAQAGNSQEEIGKVWQEFQPAGKNPGKEILRQKAKIAGRLQGNEDLLLFNEVTAVNYTASLLKEGKVGPIKPADLKKVLGKMDWKDTRLAKLEGLGNFIENYYALLFIGEGAATEDAWGGMWFNTTVETLGNKYDYKRYAKVLESGNPELITAYLECLRRVFRYDGYTRGLEEIRPLFEKNFPEGELKKEIQDLYESYYHLREGAVAPAFTLKDFRGKEHALSDYKGKVLVVDVWATWCGGCILKLPEFMKMRETYKDRKDIEFITISIDDAGSFKSWKYTLPRLKLMEVTNLLAPKEECTFSKDYNITGIPRYFLFDKQGNIVSVYAPTPGKDFKKLIDKTLNQ